jgi:hypothetical protein
MAWFRFVQLRMLLTNAAALEGGIGVALAVAPPAVVVALLGSPLDLPAGLVIGAALLSLGTACAFARDHAQSGAAAGLIAAMLPYNLAVVSLLGQASIGLRMST